MHSKEELKLCWSKKIVLLGVHSYGSTSFFLFTIVLDLQLLVHCVVCCVDMFTAGLRPYWWVQETNRGL